MGLTKDYLRYVHSGSCGCVGSANGEICAIDATTCAVTACENVNIYNMRTNEKVHEISQSTREATCMKFSHDKRWQAVGYADGVIRLFDRKASDDSCVIFSGHKKGVSCLAFSDDGLTLASGGKDCVVILWDIVSESGLFRLNGHKGPITHMAFARDDQFLVTSSKDCLVKFWSLKSQNCFFTIYDSSSEVYSFTFFWNCTLMVVASAEAELLVFELIWLEDGKIPTSDKPEEPSPKKASEAFSDENTTMEAMANRYVRVNMRGKLLRQCKGRALQLAVSPDKRFIICLGSDKIADVYRVYNEAESNKRLAKKLKSARKRMMSDEGSTDVHEDEIKKDVTILIARIGDYRTSVKIKWVDFANVLKEREDGSVNYSIFALMSNNTVHLLKMTSDPTSKSVVFDCTSTLDRLGHRSDIRSLSVSSSNNAIVSGGGNELMIWNTNSLRPVASLQNEGMVDVTAVVFTQGDGYVVAATKTGELFLWDVAGCELLESRKGHEKTVWAIAHSPDGKQLLSVSSDKHAKFWMYEVVAEGT
ncbi:WD domain G-beta repeat protein, partial [Trichostrongylus colubriformis]